MTDNEIIKAMKDYAEKVNHAAFFQVNENGAKELHKILICALNFIYNLKADKEALIAGQETLQKALAEKIEESENQSQNFKVLISDHRTLQQSFDNLKGLYEAEKAKVEKAKEKSIYFAKELQTAKAEIERLKINLKAVLDERADHSEAIKEFAEKLKTEAKLRNHINYGANQQAVSYNEGVIETRKFMLVCIDNLVKEMVGDAE